MLETTTIKRTYYVDTNSERYEEMIKLLTDPSTKSIFALTVSVEPIEMDWAEVEVEMVPSQLEGMNHILTEILVGEVKRG